MADYPAELAYDFRSRFGISVDEIGASVSYLETIYLTAILMRDPSSWLSSAKQGWKHPASREWIVVQDLYNLTMAINSSKKQKLHTYPTPWEKSKGRKVGNTGERSQEEILARLEKMNPKEPNASE